MPILLIAFIIFGLIVVNNILILVSIIHWKIYERFVGIWNAILFNMTWFFMFWVILYAGQPWQYYGEEELTVKIDDGHAYVVYDGASRNLNQMTGRNYQAGEKVTLKMQSAGPYIGIKALPEDRIIVE